MANCNDCLHEEVCDMSSRQIWSIMTGEKECTDFKDRAKYVEVVRCKDCKFYDEDTSENGECKVKRCVVCGTETIMAKYGFCSCGERRTDG